MMRRLLLLVVFLLLGYGFWLSPQFKDIAAGVAIFLFGMLCMEDGFRAFSGGSLERILQASTDRGWKSLGFGIVTTTLMQSSSLVSVITISFLSAGLLTLSQGIGIIFGANLGTTTGAWIVAGFGLKVDIGAYALPLLVFGVILLLQQAKSSKGIGWISLGLGFLFLGIHYMKTGFASYAEHIDLTQYAVSGFAGLLLYTLIGMLATVVMQSSHATLVLTITALGAGQITYENALALAIGANIGTTITAILGSLNATIAGKRLAAAHLLFNLVTGLLAILLIRFFMLGVDRISQEFGIAADDYTLKLAVFHTLFNLAGVLVMTPLTQTMVRWLERVLRERKPGYDGPRYLSDAALELPDVALQALTRETRHLFRNAHILIAHGISLRSAELSADSDLRQLLEPMGKVIELDIDQQYDLTIKEIYSANVAFITKAQARAPDEYGERFQALWRANANLVAAIKAVKHLRKNLLRYMRSNNKAIRQEYNRLRIRIGHMLRALRRLAQEEVDMTVAQLSLDEIRVEVSEAGHLLNKTVDGLIREGSITPQMATSLMNDSGYATEVMQRLLTVSESLFAAAGPADGTHPDLALSSEEIDQMGHDLAKGTRNTAAGGH